jgi:hypothetical protein
MTRAAASIPTAASLHRAHRRLDRHAAGVHGALQAMRHGEFLHLQYVDGRSHWTLSNGRTVSAAAAGTLTSNVSIIPADDALFSDLPGQSWRYAR